jgi:hypothetical protein
MEHLKEKTRNTLNVPTQKKKMVTLRNHLKASIENDTTNKTKKQSIPHTELTNEKSIDASVN